MQLIFFCIAQIIELKNIFINFNVLQYIINWSEAIDNTNNEISPINGSNWRLLQTSITTTNKSLKLCYLD